MIIPIGQVRGQDIAIARNALPVCRFDSPDTITGAVEIPDLGAVVITFAKMKSQLHKTMGLGTSLRGDEQPLLRWKGGLEKVIDEMGDEPSTRICPRCSVCGKPHISDNNTILTHGLCSPPRPGHLAMRASAGTEDRDRRELCRILSAWCASAWSCSRRRSRMPRSGTCFA